MFHFKPLIIRDLFVKVFSLVCLFVLVNDRNDILVYSGLYVFSMFISSLVNFLYLKKRYKISFNPKLILHSINLKEIIFKIFPISILTTIYLSFDVTLVGYFLSEYDTGIYSFSLKVIRLFLLIFDSVFVVLTPVLAYKLSQQESLSNINDTLKIIISNLFGMFIPLCFLLIIFSDQIVYILGGQAFHESSLILKLLTPMAFFYIYSSLIGSQILYNIGEFRMVRNILFFVLIFSLVIGIYLVNTFQLFGILITINLTFIVLTFIYYYNASKLLKGIRLFSFDYFKNYFIAALIPSIVILTLYKPQNDKIDFLIPIYGIVFFVFYFLILLIFRENYLLNHVRNLFIKK